MLGSSQVDHPTGREPGSLRCVLFRFYTDPDVLWIEKDPLFFRTWRYACHAGSILDPGDFTTVSIFDQDLFPVWGRDGEVRAVYSVCPHRGHRLFEDRGVAPRCLPVPRLDLQPGWHSQFRVNACRSGRAGSG